MAEEGGNDVGAAGGTLKLVSDTSYLINYVCQASHERWMIGRCPTCLMPCLLARINDSIITDFDHLKRQKYSVV